MSHSRGERDLRLRFVAVPCGLDAGRRWKHDDVFSAEELRMMIAAQWPAALPLERTPASTARVFRFAEGPGEIGFIPSVTEPYYADRDRIRLTADGQLRTCLFAQEETDLRGPLWPAPRTPSSRVHPQRGRRQAVTGVSGTERRCSLVAC